MASSHDPLTLNDIPKPIRLDAARRSPAAQAWILARELAASAPGRFTLAVILLLAAGVTEAFGLLMIVPLLQVAGLTDAAGEPGSFAEAAASVAAWLGVPPTLPGVLGVFLGLSAVRAADRPDRTRGRPGKRPGRLRRFQVLAAVVRAIGNGQAPPD